MTFSFIDITIHFDSLISKIRNVNCNANNSGTVLKKQNLSRVEFGGAV